jgi:N4-gp56 family major capsid protein
VVVNTYGSMTDQQRTHYSRIILARLLPALPMLGQGMQGSIPTREGGTFQWNYLAPFARATTPLTEGSPPSETAMVWSKVTATPQQYGAWAKISDLAESQSINPQVAAATAAFGENAGQTLHTVLINVLAAGTNLRYADAVAGRSSVASSNVYDAAEARRAKRILGGANAGAYNDGYHALIHPFVEESLMADTTILTAAQYSGGISKANGAVNMLTGEVLQFNGFKYMSSTDAPVFAGAGSAGIDVYGTLHFGPGWFGEVDFSAFPIGSANSESNRVSGVEPIVIPREVNSKSDPLKQYGVVGWIARGYVAKILQQERGLRVESAAAA